ncbi:MAG: hypothetical protein K2X71_27570 [Methylobacterium sp.]|uniref:hypothetical protein n=1 Tax=Methylobacterium sp. TaxID=409 RepID=UPI00258B78F2|nr:hypothetical protein [Methylobacterium sp.]MBY0299752.1 hypothetical protein [Methylobacterium sp.]
MKNAAIGAAVVLPLSLALSLPATPALAGPCSQDIALLDKRLSQMGVDPAAMAADTTGSTGSLQAQPQNPPGISTVRGTTTLPPKSAAGQAAGTSRESRTVDPRALATLQEARRADLQGDAKACKDAVATVRKHLDG